MKKQLFSSMVLMKNFSLSLKQQLLKILDDLLMINDFSDFQTLPGE
jgi:hypothetical protein